MKLSKLFVSTLVAACSMFSALPAHAGPGDSCPNALQYIFRNEANNGAYLYYACTWSTDSVMIHDYSQNALKHLKLGAGLTRSGDFLNTDPAAALGYTPASTSDPRFTDSRMPLAHLHTMSDVSGLSAALSGKADKATTMAGYGIADGVTSASLSTALSAKFNTPAGGTAQYVRGDGSLATLPTVPVVNRAIVTTASDGTYTWTFPTACSGTAVVSVTPQNSTSGEVINHKVTAASSTSMTVATTKAIIQTPAPLLGLSVPVIQTASAQTLHLIAVCP